MVLKQFQTRINIFHGDNGKDFFNKILDNFFIARCIVHQSSCTNIPRYNVITERKKKYLLEVARVLNLQTKVYKYIWGYAILTATYLTNRLPT